MSFLLWSTELALGQGEPFISLSIEKAVTATVLRAGKQSCQTDGMCWWHSQVKRTKHIHPCMRLTFSRHASNPPASGSQMLCFQVLAIGHCFKNVLIEVFTHLLNSA